MQVSSGILQLALLLAAQYSLTLAGPVAVSVSEQLVNVDTSDLLDSISGSGEDINVDSEQDQAEDEEYINSLLPEDDKANLYGGDILLTPHQKEILTEMELKQNIEGGVEKRAVLQNVRNLWPNNIVPYSISSQLNSRARGAISSAMKEYQEKTCIRFVQRTSQRDYVDFFPGQGCYSYIGRIGGRQDISIGSGCEFKGTVMHEIFHALGRWHEQSRADRDKHIRVNFENVRPGTESNFEKLTLSIATTNGVPYDYRSIMHYSAYAFSRNGRPTIDALNGVSRSQLGQRNGFSAFDLDHVKKLYCSETEPSGSWTPWSSWSSCSTTCGSSGRQTRSRTCQGGNDCVGNPTETRACNRMACPTWSVWSQWSTCSVSCGTGVQMRARVCVGGTSCVGATREARSCSVGQCAQWGPWREWSACSATCGAGTQARTRSCIGQGCTGQSTEIRDCVDVPLCFTPSSEQWSSWSGWSPCSSRCGYTGTRRRSRTCLSTVCAGPTIEIEKCNHGTCPEQLGNDPNWRPWGQWNTCSKPCDTGYQFRRRVCDTTRTSRCAGLGFVIRGCNYQNCPTPPPPPALIAKPTEAPYSAIGFTRTGCKEVDIRSGIPELYTLNEKRLTTNFVQGCVELAARRGFLYVGVAGGYCLSGSNAEIDYIRHPSSGKCLRGNGRYSPTSLKAYMSTYTITPGGK